MTKGSEDEKKKTPLSKSAVEGLVSQSIRYGKDYEMFCKFRRRVNQGGHSCIIGSDYVVMARTHYDEIIKAAQKGG